MDENTSTAKSAAASGTGADVMFALARQRFNATKATKDAIFILTKFEESGINGLVKVDKDSGKDLVKMPFGNKTLLILLTKLKTSCMLLLKTNSFRNMI